MPPKTAKALSCSILEPVDIAGTKEHNGDYEECRLLDVTPRGS
jgi:hypothetical protein